MQKQVQNIIRAGDSTHYNKLNTVYVCVQQVVGIVLAMRIIAVTVNKCVGKKIVNEDQHHNFYWYQKNQLKALQFHINIGVYKASI